jgi:hypothetical protein
MEYNESIEENVSSDFLIGGKGQDYLLEQLTTAQSPIQVIQQFQIANKLLPEVEGACEPIFGLLDLHEVPRYESYKILLNGMKDMLLERMKTLGEKELLEMLDKCYPYISFPELSSVPFSIMKNLPEVPIPYLQNIAQIRHLYDKCPLEIQQQVWLIDDVLFNQEFSPLLESLLTHFKYGAWHTFLSLALQGNNEGITIKPEVSYLPLFASAKAGSVNPVSDSDHSNSFPQRKKLKFSIQPLLKMIGKNKKLFDKVQFVIVKCYLDSRDVGYCCIATEILKGIIDSGNSKLITSDNSAQEFASKLDAFNIETPLAKQNEHFQAINQIFTDIQKSKLNPSLQDMIVFTLKEPSSLAIILSSIWNRIELCSDKVSMPRQDGPLIALTNLLEVACFSRGYLSKKKKEESKLNMIMTQFYPTLLISVVDYEITTSLTMTKELEHYFKKDILARKVLLFYGLKKLCLFNLESFYFILEFTSFLKPAKPSKGHKAPKPSKLDDELWFFRGVFYMTNYFLGVVEEKTSLIELDDHSEDSNSKRNVALKIMTRVIQIHFANPLLHKEIQQLILLSIGKSFQHTRGMLHYIKELLGCDLRNIDETIIQNYTLVYEIFQNLGIKQSEIQVLEDWLGQCKSIT